MTVTSEPHKHMSRQDKETGCIHWRRTQKPREGYGTAAISRSICAFNGAPIHVAGAKLGFKLLTVPLIKYFWLVRAHDPEQMGSRARSAGLRRGRIQNTPPRRRGDGAS